MAPAHTASEIESARATGGGASAVKEAEEGRAAVEAELAHLAAELSTRASAAHFARALVLGFLATIATGLTAKLAHDVVEHVWIPLAAGALAAALGARAAMSFLAGRRALMRERAKFERLCALRARLGLDG